MEWHRSRSGVHGRAQDGFGFYDSSYQIALLPQEEIEPAVVIDHEITHVNLVQNSSIGLLERVLSWLEWSAHEGGGAPEAIAAIHALVDAVLAVTATTHEAIAWLGTELQTEGREALHAPPEFAPGVQRLRGVLERMPGWPGGGISERLSEVMSVADEIGIVALNLPLMAELWETPEQVLPRLGAALRGRSDAPYRRFERLCTYFETVPYSEAVRWAEGRSGLLSSGADGEAAPRVPDLPAGGNDRSILGRRAPLAVVRRGDLPRSGTVGLVRALLSWTGLDAAILAAGDRLSTDLPDEEILAGFDDFELTHGFLPRLDRYAQACVLERQEVTRELVLGPDPARVALFLDQQPYLAVTRMRPSSSTEYIRPADWVDGLLIRAPMHGTDEHGTPLSPSWTVEVETARPFLRSYSNRGVIIASSVRYDLGAGDFEGEDCLTDIPHVVVAISDFRSLWIRLIPSGLAGSSEVEWMAMPSPSGRMFFGFLLLKPARRSFPVILNPSPVAFRRRIVGAADAVPSPRGVRLREALIAPLDWLGPMEHAVMTAAAVFEVGSRADAVMLAALRYAATHPPSVDPPAPRA